MESKEIVVQISGQAENSSNNSGSSDGSNNEVNKTTWTSDEVSYLMTQRQEQIYELEGRITTLDHKNSKIETEMGEAKDMVEKLKAERESLKMISDLRYSALETRIRELIKEEIHMKQKMDRMEIEMSMNNLCITHVDLIKELEKTVAEMKHQISQERLEHQKQLKNAKISENRESTFLEDDASTVIKQIVEKKGEVDEEASMGDGIGSGRGKTGRSIQQYEIQRLRETLRAHGPIRFFKESDYIFQLHEMRVLENYEYAASFEDTMQWDQIVKIVENNDDLAARHKYYSNLILEAAGKVKDEGSGILNYITVFETNYKSLYQGLDIHTLIEKFIFFLPINIKNEVKVRIEESKSNDGTFPHTNLNNWIMVTRDIANKKEKELHEEQTRLRTLELNNGQQITSFTKSKFKKNIKSNFYNQDSNSTDQDNDFIEKNKELLLRIIQDFKPTNVTSNTNNSNNNSNIKNNSNINNNNNNSKISDGTTPSSVKPFTGKCHNCGKEGHKSKQCRASDSWITALVDTGCSHSIISPTLINKDMKSSDCKVIIIKCERMAQTNIKVRSKHENELEYQMKLYCVNTQHKMIIGLDFLGSADIFIHKGIPHQKV
ncbi:hypothetical protein ACTFIR_003901 [Dictyostelium discoideum]